MKKYQVIGGQYEQIWYGESDTLHGARIMAGLHKEHWDNWKGWIVPGIYLAEDCADITAHGMITVPDGVKIRIYKPHARRLNE